MYPDSGAMSAVYPREMQTGSGEGAHWWEFTGGYVFETGWILRSAHINLWITDTNAGSIMAKLTPDEARALAAALTTWAAACDEERARVGTDPRRAGGV